MIKELESWPLTLIKIEETQHLRNLLIKIEEIFQTECMKYSNKVEEIL